MKKDNRAIEKGFGFGVTSGVITTLGMIVGLNSATHSFGAVVGGIIAVAFADAFSDALGIHVSEESQKRIGQRNIWITSLAALFSKLFFAFTFVIPFLIFDLMNAVYISIAWGLIVLIAYNYHLAKMKNKKPYWIIFEHVFIALVVILITRYVGQIVALLG